jgi:hypothetical protein
VRIITFSHSRKFSIFIYSYFHRNWICIDSFPYSREFDMYRYILMLQFNMYRYVSVQKISMYWCVLMLREIQHVSIYSYIYRNSICIDTFSYSRECNIIIRLTFIAIEHVSIFFHIHWNSICIDKFLCWNSICIDAFVCRKSVHIDMFLCLQNFQMYRYVLVFKDFNIYRQFLFHWFQYALACSFIHKNVTWIHKLLQGIQ